MTEMCANLPQLTSQFLSQTRVNLLPTSEECNSVIDQIRFHDLSRGDTAAENTCDMIFSLILVISESLRDFPDTL